MIFVPTIHELETGKSYVSDGYEYMVNATNVQQGLDALLTGLTEDYPTDKIERQADSVVHNYFYKDTTYKAVYTYSRMDE